MCIRMMCCCPGQVPSCSAPCLDDAFSYVVMVLQLWKDFRRQCHQLHRCLGYISLAATAVGSLSAAPYAVTYLMSAKIPETVSAKSHNGEQVLSRVADIMCCPSRCLMASSEWQLGCQVLHSIGLVLYACLTTLAQGEATPGGIYCT